MNPTVEVVSPPAPVTSPWETAVNGTEARWAGMAHL